MIHSILPSIIGQLSIPSGPGTIELGTPGTGSSSLGKAPFSYAYDYSFAAWIIESSELGPTSRTFDSLELYLGTMVSSSYPTLNQRIYMAHIDKSVWTGSLPNVNITSSENLTGTTYVKTNFSKTYVSSEVDTWINYSFNNNFTYNGNDNVVIWWENRDASFAFSGPQFDIQNKSGSVAYKRQDGSYPTGTCFLDAERPIMKLNYI